eukprot:CAMPEP_0184867160 /NCGR_PEP_ID=MMETSP0580-20130426/25215_1 /TAXON_ID=1118495 /ORGANISM="Dactyliosolen fragilissimus" /LENGTH=73 /DNA_ID=CAMNT_0027367243 /DNA_START=773 /DNA_END=991 /DNA_ORIENTATION=+
MNFLKIDINNKATSLVGSKVDRGDKYCGGALGRDGFIYAVPACGAKILRFNPKDETTIVWGLVKINGNENALK